MLPHTAMATGSRPALLCALTVALAAACTESNGAIEHGGGGLGEGDPAGLCPGDGEGQQDDATRLVCFPNSGNTRCRNYNSSDWYLWRFTGLAEHECVSPDFFEFESRQDCQQQAAALTGA